MYSNDSLKILKVYSIKLNTLYVVFGSDFAVWQKRTFGLQPAEHEPVMCPGEQEGQRHPGLYREQRGQQE